MEIWSNKLVDDGRIVRINLDGVDYKLGDRVEWMGGCSRGSIVAINDIDFGNIVFDVLWDKPVTVVDAGWPKTFSEEEVDPWNIRKINVIEELAAEA